MTSGMVSDILDDVRNRGLEAAVAYTRRFDGIDMAVDEVLWNPLKEPPLAIEKSLQEAIDYAIDNIRAFHEATYPAPSLVTLHSGVALEERWYPLPRVGVYIPNGRFPLVSTALMTIVPAQVAGVKEIVACLSPKGNVRREPIWRYVFQTLGISTVLLVGGAQGVATMAYGVPEMPAVDLIAGPGNRYVAAAKQELFRRGVVGIDLLAGPSEVMVIANNPDWEEYILADLLAQAEHDPDARAEFVTMNASLADRVARRLPSGGGLGTISVTVVQSADQAIARANQTAPEHLGLMGEDVEPWADAIWAAGALFLGPMAGQALGDYVAGPSHVLPTGGTGRFQSGLSTRTFLKRVSVIRATDQVSSEPFKQASVLAEVEGLQHHQASMVLRQKKLEGQPDGTSRHN